MLWGFAVLVVLLFALSLSIGASSTGVRDAWRWLLGGMGGTNVHDIMVYVRVPRSLSALVCGAGLAVSGLLLQSALNNPLASAGIIGVNSGAAFFATATLILWPEMVLSRTLGALGGALFTAFLVFAIAKRANLSRGAIIMAGVAVTSLMSALSDALVTAFPDSLVDKNAFFIGGFAHATLAPVLYVLPLVGIGLAGALLLAPRLNTLMLGDEVAQSLGVSVDVCRSLSLICAALLAASAVCIGGILGFVGLIVPHAVRRIAGQDHRVLVPLTAIGGGALVLASDTLCRVLLKPYELPVGILLSLMGAPFFLYLVLSKRGRRMP